MVEGLGQTSTADVFRAVSDPTRRALLDRLKLGSRAVGSLASGFPISRPAISKHLRILKEADLVMEHRKGRQRVYELNPRPLEQLDEWLDSYRAFLRANLARLKEYVENENRD